MSAENPRWSNTTVSPLVSVQRADVWDVLVEADDGWDSESVPSERLASRAALFNLLNSDWHVCARARAGTIHSERKGTGRHVYTQLPQLLTLNDRETEWKITSEHAFRYSPVLFPASDVFGIFHHWKQFEWSILLFVLNLDFTRRRRKLGTHGLKFTYIILVRLHWKDCLSLSCVWGKKYRFTKNKGQIVWTENIKHVPLNLSLSGKLFNIYRELKQKRQIRKTRIIFSQLWPCVFLVMKNIWLIRVITDFL